LPLLAAALGHVVAGGDDDREAPPERQVEDAGAVVVGGDSQGLDKRVSAGDVLLAAQVAINP